MARKFNDLFGKQFGKLNVLKFSHRDKFKRFHWMCQCKCGKTKTFASNSLSGGLSKSCGCEGHRLGKKNPLFTGFEEISGTKWKKMQDTAKNRGIQFKIDIEEAWRIFLKQEKRCVFSGVELKFNSKNRISDGNASLDRIDSSKGYDKNNVQWVDKYVNKMKQSATDKEFVDWCAKITDFQRKNLCQSQSAS